MSGQSTARSMEGAASAQRLAVGDFLDEVLGRVRAYVDGLDADVPIRQPLEPEAMAALVDTSMPTHGQGLEGVLEALDAALEHSVRTGSPRFLNQLFGGFSVAAFAGEVATALTNGSMYTYEMAPLATLVELSILRRLGEAIGWPGADGILSTGGSNGNLIGLIAAREQLVPDARKVGWDPRQWSILVSEESHYSLKNSAAVLGMGLEGIVRVPVEADGRIAPDGLRAALALSHDQGRTPMAVVLTSGTTVRGAFDPLDELIPIAHEAGAWVHVDAAWGGSALLSPRLAHLMRGSELADSLSWDPHKTLTVPLVCSAVLFRERGWLQAVAAGSQSVDYLFHPDEDEVYDLGRKSLQCGRRVDAWKLWFAWRELGDDGMAAHVERCAELTQHLGAEVEAQPSLELSSPVTWLNVTMRHLPPGMTDRTLLDAHQTELRRRIIDDGRWMLNKAVVDGNVVLRPIVSNPALAEDSLTELVHHIVRMGDELASA